MAGGKFFALIDEMTASEARLDKMAQPLLEKMAKSELLAARAVEAKHAKYDAAIDYIKRMDGVTEQLGDGDNGGPKLKTSSGGQTEPPATDEQTEPPATDEAASPPSSLSSDKP